MRCAGEQGKFWEMRHAVTLNAAALGAPVYDRLAAELGIDAARFSACIAADRYRAEIDRDMEEAMKVGVNGTPSFVLGPTTPGTEVEGLRIVGAQPFRSSSPASRPCSASAEAGRLPRRPHIPSSGKIVR